MLDSSKYIISPTFVLPDNSTWCLIYIPQLYDKDEQIVSQITLVAVPSYEGEEIKRCVNVTYSTYTKADGSA